MKIFLYGAILLWQSIILNSSMVERTAVNRDVVGSSPTWGVYIKFLTKEGIKQILSLELKFNKAT